MQLESHQQRIDIFSSLDPAVEARSSSIIFTPQGVCRKYGSSILRSTVNCVRSTNVHHVLLAYFLRTSCVLLATVLAQYVCTTGTLCKLFIDRYCIHGTFHLIKICSQIQHPSDTTYTYLTLHYSTRLNDNLIYIFKVPTMPQKVLPGHILIQLQND